MVNAKTGLEICDAHGAREVAEAGKDRTGKQLRTHSLMLLAFVGFSAIMFVVCPASAESLIDVTNITDTLMALGNNLFGGILAIVVGAWPCILVIGIIGFVGKFLDRILEMLRI